MKYFKDLNTFEYGNWWFRIFPKTWELSNEIKSDFHCLTVCFYIGGFTYWFWRAI